MRSGTMYKQGDILLIPVPFSDLTNSKQRPVLVISNDSYNRITKDIVVAAITSNVRNQEFSVLIDTTELSEGELKVTSEIRTDKIYTLSQKIVRKKFGKVNTEIMELIRKRINNLINS
jgi:mRNA interferase MazF